jgi:hypothetical protein
MLFTVFGLQRTGTNFLQKSISRNIKDIQIVSTYSDGHIWKHAFNLESPDRHVSDRGRKWYTQETANKLTTLPILHVYVHKNPYTWIESILSRSVDIHKTYPLTIEKKNPDDIMIEGKNVTYLAQLWVDHSKYWLGKNVYTIRYENVISDSDVVLKEVEKISKHFNLEMVNALTTHGVPQIDNTRRQQLSNFITPILDSNQKALYSINEILPDDLMKQMEYTKKPVNTAIIETKPFKKAENSKKVLIIASGQSAKQFDDYEFKENGWTIVAVNNAWQVCKEDLDFWIRPGDFKGHKFTDPKPEQTIVKGYGKQLNLFGGQKACGYSITLNAAYWCLAELKPSTMAFLGADMNYTPDKETGATSFYGVGWDIQNRNISDPDRMAEMYKSRDQSPEQFIEEIYLRLEKKANEVGCKVYNISNVTDTRLPYQQIDITELEN